MEIIFTGTGSGRTSLKRHHNSIILSSSGTNLLIDAGDGISRALLNSTVDYNSINAILFTHFHPDHLNGISSLLIQMKMNSRSSELRLLVHQNLYRSFLRFLETGYIFKERMGFDIRILTFATGSFFRINEEIAFISKENSHLSKYSKNTDDKETLVSSSFLIYAAGRKIFYSGDIGSGDDLYLFSDERPDIFISEMTHIDDYSQMEKVLSILKPQKVLINHISDESEDRLNQWIESLDPVLKQNISLTYDGFSISVE